MQGWMWKAVTRRLALLALLLLAVAGLAADYGAEIEAKYGLYTDFAANIRLQLIGQRVARAAEMPNISFKIFNNPELNAFALPDGRIYVTSLMATELSDAELAFVLGHEITHVKEEHASGQTQHATGGAILGAVLVAVLGGDGDDIRLGADIAGGLTYGHYSRKDENESDKGGVRLMSVSGYDPDQAAAAMQRLIDKYGRGDANIPVLGWFATHPDTKDRKERLQRLAEEVKGNPLPRLGDPRGVEIVFDASARHAEEWAHDYLMYVISSYGQGRVVVLPEDRVTTRVAGYATAHDARPVAGSATMAMAATGGSALKDASEDKDKKELKPVEVIAPDVPVGYRLYVSLREVPAGGASSLRTDTGTAVEATVRWRDLTNGFSGTFRALAQSDDDEPWQAHEQLKDKESLHKLKSGKDRNIEGTLEATALRRAAMAFSEMIEARGPIVHSAPVTIRMNTDDVRIGDYVYAIRGPLAVAAVRVNKVSDREVEGEVLWGTHTWQRGDQFVEGTM